MKNLILKLMAAAAVALAFACGDDGDSATAVKEVTLTSPDLVGGTLTVNAGTSDKRLTANLNPANASNQAVTWKSSDATVADAIGSELTVRIDAKKIGECTMTVTADGGKTATCTIKVMSEFMVTGVSLPQTATVGTAAPYSLLATISPANAENKRVTWSTANPAIATVVGTPEGQIGTVTGVAVGSTDIIVTTVDQGKTASCRVTVVTGTPVADVSMDPNSLEIFTGSTARAMAVIQPTNATNRNVTFASSNTSVATVVGAGLWVTVTAVSAGTATITVTTADGGYQATCAVTVSDPPPQKVYVGGNFGMILDGAAQSAYDGCDVYAVEVVNGAVHACGMTRGDSPKAVRWVNGVRSDLPMRAGATVSGAHGMCVDGSDVYIAGWEAPTLGEVNWMPDNFRPPVTSVSRLWKNGQTQEFVYPRNQAGTIMHTGSYGLCLAMVWEPQLDRYLLWMGGNLKATGWGGSQGTSPCDNTAVWIADPDYYGAQVITATGDNQPKHFWSMAAEPAPRCMVWTISPEFGFITIDWDEGAIDQPYSDDFAGYSVRYLGDTLYAAGYLRTGEYPAGYMVGEANFFELDDGAGPNLWYSEAWDINLGPGGVLHIAGGDFFTANGEVASQISPRLWKNGNEETIVSGWTNNKSKGLAYAVAASQ
jgi:uncharacterized protein YjdB